MKDLKHLIYFENLLQEANNELVQRAMARYEVVIDNYRSGKYPKRERFGDEFFKSQGGLMEAFASVGEHAGGEFGELQRKFRFRRFMARRGTEIRGRGQQAFRSE